MFSLLLDELSMLLCLLEPTILLKALCSLWGLESDPTGDTGSDLEPDLISSEKSICPYWSLDDDAPDLLKADHNGLLTSEDLTAEDLLKAESSASLCLICRAPTLSWYHPDRSLSRNDSHGLSSLVRTNPRLS
ncbi:hypothetical protein SAY86_025894 [Trapa natans]|uniref:Uncharacterized protein n=1 Tax=Trapa natans TaxID=22666 RepID=A0AAN7KGZ6_TRANT|nr:hypothetical protein SAY86_025894 [Trapa natans]